jgi:hypothetical protein
LQLACKVAGRHTRPEVAAMIKDSRLAQHAKRLAADYRAPDRDVCLGRPGVLAGSCCAVAAGVLCVGGTIQISTGCFSWQHPSGALERPGKR